MRKCAIIVNGYYTNNSIQHQVSTLREELQLLGVSCEVIKGNTLYAHVQGQTCVNKLGGVDFAIFLDKDVHCARMLEGCGIRLFNSAQTVYLCDDKMLTSIALCGCGVNMPVTVSSPVMYYDVGGEDFIDRVEAVISYPIVVKQSYGSMGKNVRLAKSREELTAIRNEWKLYPHLYQQFIGKGGEDKRVILIGGKVVAQMKRVNKNDFRSNVEQGGEGQLTTLSDEERHMAETVAKKLGADYLGVDILSDENGKPYFCEANSNAFFHGIQSVTGVNVARLYAKHVVEAVYGK